MGNMFEKIGVYGVVLTAHVVLTALKNIHIKNVGNYFERKS